MTVNKARFTKNKMEQKRLRLRDWLKIKLENSAYPGLIWVNKEKKLFRIPWKHGARHGWREEDDAKLFRDWSEHTGASPRDVKQHKANFRCALNSLSDVIQVPKLSKQKGEDAYRVYQMLPKKNTKRSSDWIRTRLRKSNPPSSISSFTPLSSKANYSPNSFNSFSATFQPTVTVNNQSSDSYYSSTSYDLPRYSQAYDGLPQSNCIPYSTGDNFCCSTSSFVFRGEAMRHFTRPSFDAAFPSFISENLQPGKGSESNLCDAMGEASTVLEEEFSFKESFEKSYQTQALSFPSPFSMLTSNNSPPEQSQYSSSKDLSPPHILLSKEEDYLYTFPENFTKRTTMKYPSASSSHMSKDLEPTVFTEGSLYDDYVELESCTHSSAANVNSENYIGKPIVSEPVDFSMDSSNHFILETDGDCSFSTLSDTSNATRLPSASTLLSPWSADASGTDMKVAHPLMTLC